MSPNEITRAIGGMEGSLYERGGAAEYDAFERGMADAADRIIRSSDGTAEGGGTAATAPDYDSMGKDELLAECASRGMTMSFPKMKRIIIEELRFHDAHSRQGKRHPVKNTLS